MVDFLLGFAFVAMILSPLVLASCLKHFSRLEPHPVQAQGAIRPHKVVRRKG